MSTSTIVIKVTDPELGLGAICEVITGDYDLLGDAVEDFYLKGHKKGKLFTATIDVTEEGEVITGFVEGRIVPEELVVEDWIKLGTERVSPDEYSMMQFIARLAEEEHAASVAFVGPSGYGKTQRALALAQDLDLDCVVVDCGTLTDPLAAFGRLHARAVNGVAETRFIKSVLSERLPQGNCLVLFDEINRVDSSILSSLFPILDSRREVMVEGEHITVGPNTIFAITLNQGYQYVATTELDAALWNRIDAVLTVGPPPLAVETDIFMEKGRIGCALATKIATVLDALRNSNETYEEVDVSTRPGIRIAKLCRVGTPLKQAFHFGLVAAAPTTLQRGLTDVINSELE